MNNKKLKLYKEVLDYNQEYKKAIKELMKLDDVNKVLSPLTLLKLSIFQSSIKKIKFPKTLKIIEQTHIKNWKKILKKYPKNTQMFEHQKLSKVPKYQLKPKISQKLKKQSNRPITRRYTKPTLHNLQNMI